MYCTRRMASQSPTRFAQPVLWGWLCDFGAKSLSVQFVEGGGECRQQHCLIAIGAGRDHADLCAGFLFEEAEVILRDLRQLVEFGNAFGRFVPALQFRIHALDGFEAAHVGGHGVDELAVDLVSGADGNFVERVEHVKLRYYQPLRSIDLVRVAQQGQIEPAAAARATGYGAEFLAARAQKLAGFVEDFCREWAFADAGDVGFGDADDGADACRADAGSGDSSACGGGGGCHERVRPVVDVEHRSLCAFKHDAATFIDGFVQQVGRVGDERRDLFGGVRVLVVHLGRVERFGTEERISDGVLFVAGVFDVRLKQISVQQIDDAEAVAGHLVFIGGADAAAGGADLLAAGRAFGSELDHAVVFENDLRTVRDEELLIDVDAEVAQLPNFAQEGQRVEYNAVADDSLAGWPQNAAGDELENELLAADDDGVSGVVSASVAGHDGKALGEHVDDLAFAFIAPLGAENDCCFCSHLYLHTLL